MVAYQDTCLALDKDEVKNQFVVEQFCMDNESEWRPVTVLPNEQQLSCVSVALQDNLVYTWVA